MMKPLSLVTSTAQGRALLVLVLGLWAGSVFAQGLIEVGPGASFAAGAGVVEMGCASMDVDGTVAGRWEGIENLSLGACAAVQTSSLSFGGDWRFSGERQVGGHVQRQEQGGRSESDQLGSTQSGIQTLDWQLSAGDWDRLTGLDSGATLSIAALDRQAVSRTLTLERIELRAPDAELWVVENGRARLEPWPDQRVLRGRVSEHPDWLLVLVIDSAGELATGAVYAERGVQVIRAYPQTHVDALRLRAFDVEDLLPDGTQAEFRCANAELRSVAGYEVPSAALHFESRSPAPVRGSALRAGVLAIDTDREWLQNRFNNNVNSAAEWTEQLMAVSNLIFERDLGLRMLQGETILRVGSDPYTSPGSTVNQARLEQFGQVWFSNFANVPRTHAALISGRSPIPNQAAGIAWINSYCQTQATGGSYSLNQLFWGSNFGVANSARVFAHEIGHNLGSRHTHCYNPPVDQCFNAEPGCYTGPVSCPAAGSGTLMSYCNFGPPAGAGCGQNRLELHPRVAELINGRITANFPNCITPLLDPGVIFSDRFQL
ncbi:MAG: M12 family metallo-peptidase [Wenzhouxiangella sp.]